MRALLAAVAAAVILPLAASCAAADLEIKWGKPFDLGRGFYARIHKLADGRLMAAYSLRGGIVARFYERGDKASGRNGRWTEPVDVAKGRSAENGTEKVWLSTANAEFAQLETGRIIYACNLRPAGNRASVHPYAIAIATSDDAGATWSPLKIVYRGRPSGDGVERGCYEPFVLPGKGNKAQIYYADETPYEEKRAKYQEISVIETSDGGETWSAPRAACYAPRCRDGMPAVVEFDGWRLLSIETNPSGTLLHPQVIRNKIADGWSKPVTLPSPDRFEPLASPPDWRKTYGGAPYIAATENYLLLSWQEYTGKGDLDVNKPVARVAAMPKSEASGGCITAMRGVSSPSSVCEGRDRMMWPSLCALGGDNFLLVAECDGRVKVFPGRVKAKP